MSASYPAVAYQWRRLTVVLSDGTTHEIAAVRVDAGVYGTGCGRFARAMRELWTRADEIAEGRGASIVDSRYRGANGVWV